MCGLLCAANAGAAESRQATSSSAPKTTVHKKSTKKHHRPTKFVPKQKAPTADRISEIQTALSRGGYYQGDPTGKWDGNTVAAMQKFQSANGIDANGKIDAPTLQKLGLGSDIAGVSAPKPVTPGGSGAQSTPPPAAAPASAPGPASSTATAAVNSSSNSLASKSPAQ